MFKTLRDRLKGWREKAETEVAPDEVVGDRGRKIDPKKLEEVLYDLEIALLESDVAFSVSKDVTFEEGVEIALRSAIGKALTVPPLDLFGFVASAPKPVVIMFVGVNGTGKTTTIAKLAYHL